MTQLPECAQLTFHLPAWLLQAAHHGDYQRNVQQVHV